jgi:ATP synthase I chain
MTTDLRRSEALRSAQLYAVGLGLVAALVAVPLYGVHFATSLAVGAALGTANLWLISRGVRAMLGDGPGRPWKLAFVLKFSVAIAGLYLLFARGLVQGLPLLLGLLALPVGILLSQLNPASR